MCKRLDFQLYFYDARHSANTAILDFQDRPLKSLRPALHDSGNRKCGRTAPALPIRWLNNNTLLSDTRAPQLEQEQRGKRETCPLRKKEKTKHNFDLITKRGLARTSLVH